jgi:hypothetical protein
MNEIDKILTQARNHYQTTADTEGRGRFPGQEKYNVRVGGYTAESDLLTDINNAPGATGNIETFTDSDLSNWRSVFGISNTAALRPDNCPITDDEARTTDRNGNTVYNGQTALGHTEWLELFAGNTLTSKYQDGHFAYAVIAGDGTGSDSYPPVLYVIDVENASNFNNVIEP